MSSFSYSDCLLQGSPYLRWDTSIACISDRNRRSAECRDLGVIRRHHNLLPDTRLAWQLCLQRELLLSLTLATNIEVRSGHDRGGSSSSSVLCVALERGGDRLLLSGGLDGRVCLYRLDSPPESPSASESGVSRLGAERTIIRALASSSRCVRREPGREEGHGGAVSTVQWYPEDPPGAFLSSSLDGSLLVWDTEHFEVAGAFQLDSKVFVSKVNCSTHSGVVACGTEKHGIRLCDLRTGDAVHSLAPVLSAASGGSHASVRALDWSPTGAGNLLVAGSDDGCVRLWDMRKGGSGTYLLSFDAQHEDHLNQIDEDHEAPESTKRPRDVSVDSRRDDASAYYSEARVPGVDSLDDESYIDFTSRRRMEARYSAALCPSDQLSGRVLSGVSERVRRRHQAHAAGQAVDWRREGAAVAHRGTEVVALKYTPSGAHLVSCGNDGQVLLWGTASGKKYPRHFSPGGCRTRLRYDIDVVSFGGVGDEMLLHPCEAAAGGGAGLVAMTPLHSSGSSPSGENARVLRGHVEDVMALQFSADKSRVVSAGKDGMIFLWEGTRNSPLSSCAPSTDLSQDNREGVGDNVTRTGGNAFWQSDDESDEEEGVLVGGRHFVPPILLQR